VALVSQSLSSVVATVAGIGGTVSDLLGGGTTVTLGGFVFKDIQVPATMRWGVRQRIVRQRLPGGVIVANMNGPDWPPIAWRGILEGPQAVRQAQQLYTMTKAGQPLQLSWMSQVFIVAIESFVADDTTTGWVPYKISCQVLADASQINGPPAPPSLAQQILGNVNAAVGFDVVDAAGQAASVLSQVQVAAGVVGALVPGTQAFTTLSSAAGIASGVVAGAIPLAETAVNGLDTVVSGATAAMTWLGRAVSGTGNLAQATAANGYLGAAQSNMAVDDGTT